MENDECSLKRRTGRHGQSEELSVSSMLRSILSIYVSFSEGIVRLRRASIECQIASTRIRGPMPHSLLSTLITWPPLVQLCVKVK